MMKNQPLEHPEIKPIGSGGDGPLFSGKRFLITGASSGIGYGLAERLLQRGAAEVWICSQNEKRLDIAMKKLDAGDNRLHGRTLDVCDFHAMEAFLGEMAAGGSIDYVFANAGVSMIKAFEETSRAEFERIMEVNLYGVWNTDQAALPHLLRQGYGHILNMASMEGFSACGYHAAYVTSKFAVMGLTQALRYEYADRGIRFSAICPGPVISNIWGRDETGRIHTELAAPEGALTGAEAADEILAGIEEERPIILVTDTARTAWQKWRDAPASADRWSAGYTRSNRSAVHHVSDVFEGRG